VEAPEDRLAELTMQAEYARRRLDLYRARAYGMRPVSESRMRELEREADSAEQRLRAARRARHGHQSAHDARPPSHDR
jgi:hypothetical protein